MPDQRPHQSNTTDISIALARWPEYVYILLGFRLTAHYYCKFHPCNSQFAHREFYISLRCFQRRDTSSILI